MLPAGGGVGVTASARIVGTAVGLAVAYGIVHDQITARICVEYFTIGHPRLVESEDPTVLGVVWGVVATWWAGAILGVVLAVAARAGRRPRVEPRALLRPMLILLVVMALAAVAAGFVGGALARDGWIRLVGPLARAVPAERHVAFLTAGWAHGASYVVGSLGGLVLCAMVWRRRRRGSLSHRSVATS